MRVAHGDEGALEGAIINSDSIIKCTATIHGKLLWLLQDGCAHIHRNALHLVVCIEMQLENLDA